MIVQAAVGLESDEKGVLVEGTYFQYYHEPEGDE